MIDSKALLADLKKQLKVLTADLRERAEDSQDSWGLRLREQHRAALARGRTGHTWVTWRDGEVDQAAVAWLIATTFVRFCEDNDLLDGARDADGRPVSTIWLAGPGERRSRAEEHETEFFTTHPAANRRDWMQQAFAVLAAQPAGRALVDPRHSLVWTAEISAEAADGLVAFWRATDPNGSLVHDFTDARLDTRFLGDLYQDLSEYAKKTFALLQTPEFVEEFILDQTLAPAIEEFGIDGLKVIDPTCGSGHFLLGAFARLNTLWAEHSPGLDVRERVSRAMDSIHGVDLNPFAVAIARFRLTVAGLQAAGLRSLVEAPELGYHLAVGDSLLAAQGIQMEIDLHGDRPEEGLFEYDEEDVSEYADILKEGRYHVVVGNPPYITVKDKALNQAYRLAYPMAAGKYALSVPFMELFFRLALKGRREQSAGYVGQITANSFMKREFGKKVIETLLAGRDLSNPVDLTRVIDTSGAYIPGHGTPTVILVGRRRRPQGDSVRAVLGVRGEPAAPENPAKGLVWREIVEHLETPPFSGQFVSVVDLGRPVLTTHPWSISGGGATDLLQTLEASPRTLSDFISAIGYSSITGDDEFLIAPWHLALRTYPEAEPYVIGESIRDYGFVPELASMVPMALQDVDIRAAHYKHLWPGRTVLANRLYFGKTPAERGIPWWGYAISFPERTAATAKIVYSNIATHNHFAVDRTRATFNAHGQVVIPKSSQDVSGLLAVLGSSVACFWLRQVSHNKGDSTDSRGARVTGDPAFDTYEFTGTKMKALPLPVSFPSDRGQRLDGLAQELAGLSPRAVLGRARENRTGELAQWVSEAEDRWRRRRARLMFEQEELDWDVYRLYGLVDDDFIYTGSMPDDERLLNFGERAFEIALARKVAAGSEESSWFERHRSTPLTQLPEHWPSDYRALVERRLELIGTDMSIGLLERPDFKRRWATPGWDKLLRQALNAAVLERLEGRELWFDASGQPVTRSVAELADAVRHDGFFVQCVGLLAGSAEADLTKAIADLLKDQPVPYLAALRLKEAGVEKYREWQRVWSLQRREDAGEKVTIAIPPKYGQADFRKTSYWQARGKLDVPKERFIAYPGVVRTGDSTPVIGWAGWDHVEQAQALAREIGGQQALGAADAQLIPLLAGLVELEPWLDQWHGEIDPRYGTSPADAIHQTVEHYLSALGVTRAELDAWRPPAPTRGRKASTSSSSVSRSTQEEES